MFTTLALLTAFAQGAPQGDWALLGVNPKTGAYAYASFDNPLGLEQSGLSGAPACSYQGWQSQPAGVTLHLQTMGRKASHQQWLVTRYEIDPARCVPHAQAIAAVEAAKAAWADAGVVLQPNPSPEVWFGSEGFSWRPEAEPEAAAMALLKQVNTQIKAGELDQARALLRQLNDDFPDTRANRSAKRIRDELAVLGKDVGPLEVVRWFNHPGSYESKATLVVFWEAWCPHCKREVPKLQPLFKTWGPRGLNVVALTKVSRSSTDQDITAFIEDHDLQFAVGKDDGHLTEVFGVRGIPAAAVVRDGKIIWRGHPASISELHLARWLSD